MLRSIVLALASVFALSIAAASLTACNTIHGMGQDVSAVGHAVTGSGQQTEERR